MIAILHYDGKSYWLVLKANWEDRDEVRLQVTDEEVKQLQAIGVPKSVTVRC